MTDSEKLDLVVRILQKAYEPHKLSKFLVGFTCSFCGKTYNEKDEDWSQRCLNPDCMIVQLRELK